MLQPINSEVVNGEKRWTYSLKITFNEKEIIEVTITDHYQGNHPEITNELIIALLIRMDGEILKPTKYLGKRKVYKWEKDHGGKRYRLIFWHNDSNSAGLWIKNCYPIDKI